MAFSAEWNQRYQWPVSASRKIAASPQRIWSVIASPGNLKDCHPFCEANPVIDWPGVGSKDTIHYYSGRVFQREFVNWMDGEGYDLVIGEEGGQQSYVSWRITQEGEDAGRLHITIYPHILQNTPAALRWIPYRVYVQPALTRYLESVVSGFEWFITTREPVRRNQFGSHKWFSR